MEQAPQPAYRRAIDKVVRSAVAATTTVSILAVPSSEDMLKPKAAIRSESPEFDGKLLKVMSANVHQWDAPSGGSNFEAFQRVLEEEQPDVVCIQEMRSEFENSMKRLYEDGYNVLFAPTIYDARFWGFIPYQTSPGGNGVITPYTVEFEYSRTLVRDGLEKRNIMSARLLGEHPVIIKNTHLRNRGEGLYDIIKVIPDLIESMQQENTAVVFCGDMNLTPDTLNKTELVPALGIDPLESKPSLRSIPATAEPRRQIDFVIVVCGQEIDSYTRDGKSDHFFVVTTYDVSGCYGEDEASKGQNEQNEDV